jgi:hypothetical protein
MGPSKLATDQVLAMLSNQATGFNAAFYSLASSYGVDVLSIDWDPTRTQFWPGNLTPDQIDESTTSEYPMAFLYSTGARSQNTQKFAVFSGTVTVQLDIWLSWDSPDAIDTFEATGNAVEDVLVGIFNSSGASWGGNVYYNGDITIDRGRLEMAGQNWRQRISCRLILEVLV